MSSIETTQLPASPALTKTLRLRVVDLTLARPNRFGRRDDVVATWTEADR